jgi:hypothetical protein
MTRRQIIQLAGTANSISMYRNRSGAGKRSRAPVRSEAGLRPRTRRCGRDRSVVARGRGLTSPQLFTWRRPAGGPLCLLRPYSFGGGAGGHRA